MKKQYSQIEIEIVVVIDTLLSSPVSFKDNIVDDDLFEGD